LPNDHLAAAVGRTEVAQRTLRNNRRTGLAVGLQRIVEEDQLRTGARELPP